MLAPGGAEARAEWRVREQPLERAAKRRGITRRDEQARFLVPHEVEKAADGARDDSPPVSHCLGADDSEPLVARRADDHGGALVEPAQLLRVHEAERVGEPIAERPVARDDEVEPARGGG